MPSPLARLATLGLGQRGRTSASWRWLVRNASSSPLLLPSSTATPGCSATSTSPPPGGPSGSIPCTGAGKWIRAAASSRSRTIFDPAVLSRASADSRSTVTHLTRSA
eukprot:384893-Prorocentrum_minimum.AAC.2